MEVIGSIYTGVTADFQRGLYPIARCVKAGNHDLGVVLMKQRRLGNLYGDDRGTGFAGNVWDKNYISPSLTTAQGGMREPMIVDKSCPTLTAQNQEIVRIESKYRIRKFTPRECGRLMGVSDEDISKMAAVNSNTQLYKQFGNSIVVDVMCAMFRNLNINQ